MAISKNGTNGRWRDIYVFRVYELIKTGMSERAIAQSLGIHWQTLRSWMKKKPIFSLAVKEARKSLSRTGEPETFQEYVYKRLPEDRKKDWEELNALEKAKSGVDKIEALLKKKGVRARQYLFIHAWIASNFSVGRAMRKVNISRAVFNQWKDGDPLFARMVEDIIFYKKDFFQSHLCRLVAGGDSPATIFANRTFNRDEFGESKGGDINVNINQQTINQNFVQIDKLDLSVETRRELLKAIEIRTIDVEAENAN